MREHPNADALELAQVGLFSAVVRKGDFQNGDYAIYIPEQAVLPAELIEELGLTGRLAGRDKNRVKAIRLRGELSQGIVCRPASMQMKWEKIPDHFAEDETAEFYTEEGGMVDWAEELGITKWVPPIPVGMAGQVESAPDLIRWIEVENIKRYPGMFEPGELVVATEEVHGTCCLLTYQLASDEVWVSSKGQGGKNLALLPSDGNVYWRAVRQYRLADVARSLCKYMKAERVGLFGEVFGQGVQDLHYGAKADRNETLGYVLFDIAVQINGETQFLDAELMDLAIAHLQEEDLRGTPVAPVLYRGPYDYEELAALASGSETVSGESLHMREGVVVRPNYERRSGETGGRCIAKFISPEYLVRGGVTTEYE